MDRYEIVNKLGAGGCGAVFLARSNETKKWVPLFVLNSNFAIIWIAIYLDKVIKLIFALYIFHPLVLSCLKFAQTPVVREILFLDNTFSNSKFVLNLLSVLNLNLNLPTTRAKGVKIEISLLLVVNLFYEYNLNTG